YIPAGPATVPPPRFWRCSCTSCLRALLAVMTTSSRPRLSRASSWGERPRAPAREKLWEGVLNPAPPSAGPGRAGLGLRGAQGAVVALRERWGGGRVATLQGRNPVGDGAGGRHGISSQERSGAQAVTRVIVNPPARTVIFSRRVAPFRCQRECTRNGPAIG